VKIIAFSLTIIAIDNVYLSSSTQNPRSKSSVRKLTYPGNEKISRFKYYLLLIFSLQNGQALRNSFTLRFVSFLQKFCDLEESLLLFLFHRFAEILKKLWRILRNGDGPGIVCQPGVLASRVPVVNFINILRAAFVPLFFCQKNEAKL
jgi:hypothetical protein